MFVGIDYKKFLEKFVPKLTKLFLLQGQSRVGGLFYHSTVLTAQLQYSECTERYSLSTFIIEGDKGQKLVHVHCGKLPPCLTM